MKAEVAKMKEESGGGTNQEIAKKLKKANDESKTKAKMLEEAQKEKRRTEYKSRKRNVS